MVSDNGISGRMGRPPLGLKNTAVRLSPSVMDRMDALVGKNRRAAFIREAVEKELAFREAKSPTAAYAPIKTVDDTAYNLDTLAASLWRFFEQNDGYAARDALAKFVSEGDPLDPVRTRLAEELGQAKLDAILERFPWLAFDTMP